MAGEPLRVVLEVAPKRSFASAVDWPGWARSGKTPEAALESLLAYAPRYASVAKRARVAFSAPKLTDGVEVLERLDGGGGTEFGVPGEPSVAEDEPVGDADLKRLKALLRASWATLDEVAEKARGVELRKGPRGGGRDLDKILGHVLEADAAYLGQLGARPPKPLETGEVRDAFLDTLEARVTGRPIANPRNTRSRWSPRYAVRRSAWHVLDHAWEIEDRST